MAAEHQPALPDSDSRYLSVAQVARRLGCSVSLVQKWRRLGWLQATRLGPPEVPVYGYLPADVDRFVEERWNRRRGRPPGSTKPVTRQATSSPFSAAMRLTPPSADLPASSGTACRPPAPLPEAVPKAPAAAPATRAPTGRPLVLWDADPSSGRPIVLARFAPSELDYARRVAAAWAVRYPTLILGELPRPGEEIVVVEHWANGRRAGG